MKDTKTAVDAFWKSSAGVPLSTETSEEDRRLLCDIENKLAGSETVLWLDSHGPDGETERRIRLLPGKKASGILQDAVSKAVKIEDWCNGKGLRTSSFCEDTRQVLTAWAKPADRKTLILPDGTYKLNELSGFFLTDKTFRYELKDGHSVTVGLADVTHCQEEDELAFVSLALAVQLRTFLSAVWCTEFSLIKEINQALQL